MPEYLVADVGLRRVEGLAGVPDILRAMEHPEGLRAGISPTQCRGERLTPAAIPSSWDCDTYSNADYTTQCGL